MSYPTPTIYTYRVTSVLAKNQGTFGFFTAQFSKDGGTTFLPIFPYHHWSLNEAMQAIGFIVSDEANFKKIVDGTLPAPQNTNSLVPTVTTTAYPPA